MTEKMEMLAINVAHPSLLMECLSHMLVYCKVFKDEITTTFIRFLLLLFRHDAQLFAMFNLDLRHKELFKYSRLGKKFGFEAKDWIWRLALYCQN